MKLVMAIVNDSMAPGIMERLLKKGFRITRLVSSGGFLRRRNSTLLSGIEDEEAILVTKIIKDYVEFQKTKALNEDNEEAYQQATATIMVIPVEECIRV